ncbi:replication terminator protein [Clostridium kluyveri]|uniref:Replication terminator protein n=1 Tax=Clostridium kluyveri TaxID=1534 RepID=A0A1L5F8R0_CLOKL|nr:replication terminator protein [Clostridium kluyveri]APM39416.1 replication terminator protein [Clostridium kluyveri]
MAKKLNLENLAGGAFTERVNQAIQEVMENISDPNTPWKTKRKVVITMVFEANEDRNITNVDIVSKPTLAPKEGVHTNIIIDRDLDGEIIAAEYKKQIPGQQAVKIDTETGEILEKKENDNQDNTDGLKIVK